MKGTVDFNNRFQLSIFPFVFFHLGTQTIEHAEPPTVPSSRLFILCYNISISDAQ
jgi:hypothetical protein